MAYLAAVAAKRQPIFLPGFDRHTQLAMEFSTIEFGSAWLRRTFTNEHDPSVKVRLAADEHNLRERRLAEVRYGNNITLLLKACYFLRDFHGCASLWTAISRIFSSKPDVAEAVTNLFVEARAIYRSNFSVARDTAPLVTDATHWADKWTSFLDERRPPGSASDSEVFAAVDEFFRKEELRHGDLACILSKGAAMEPPTAPRALRKRSPSPASQGTPSAKRRAISRSTDEPVYDSPPGRTRTQSFGARSQLPSHHKPEAPETTSGANDRQCQNDQVQRTSPKEPYFELKIRGQAQRVNRNSPNHQDFHGSEADEYEALAQSNIELQDRVDALEKERLQAARAQKDRDDAIRALQARFAAFEKSSAVASTQSSNNEKLIREMRDMVKRLITQAEKIQQMEKQLKLSDQVAQKMQATIFSLQINEALQAQPPNGQVGAATAETKKSEEGPSETLKKEISEMHVKIKSLEAKSVLFNDLHKNVRSLKAEIAAQKDEAAAPTPDSANEQNNQDTSTRLRVVEEEMKRQVQAVQEMTNSVAALEDQALVRNAKITSLELRPDMAKEISQLGSRVSTVEQNQIDNLKMLDCRLTVLQNRSDEIEDHNEELSNRLDDVGSLPLIKAISDDVAEMRTRLANVEEHGTETSKRLDDMEVSQDAMTLHDHSSRIDEVSQSLESFKALLLALGRSDDVETLRAEFKSLSQRQTVASQSIGQGEVSLASVKGMVERLSNRMTRLNEMYEQYMADSHQGPDQLCHTIGNTLQNGSQTEFLAVVDSLCKRVSVVENGFQILRDAMSGRRR